MSVTRYHNWCLATHKHQMMEDKAGAYVLAADCNALEAKLAESEARCERLKAISWNDNVRFLAELVEVEAKLAFYAKQHAVAMETVGRLSDEVQQAQQEARELARLLEIERKCYLDATSAPQSMIARYQGDVVLAQCQAMLAKYGEKSP